MEDPDIIQSVLSGNHAAFRSLIERHYAGVFRFCVRMARNAPDAEDLAHQTFVKAFMKLGQLRDPRRFEPWLKTLALNTCRMWLRARRREQAHAQAALLTAASSETSPETRAARLGVTIRRLTGAHQLVLALHYYEGLSYREMAAFLGVPDGTVMSRLSRARAELRKAIEISEAEEEDMDMQPTGFDEEIMAEIEVLLEGESPAKAGARIAPVLSRVPQRLRDFLRRAEGDGRCARIALVLKHQPPETVAVAVESCFAEDTAERFNARCVARSIASEAVSRTCALGATPFPPRLVYMFLDALIRSERADRDKAELLVELLAPARDDAVTALLANTLMCYREETLSLLLSRFWDGSEKVEPWLLFLLCRAGNDFASRLVDALSPDSPALVIALTGAEALSRCLAQWAKVVERIPHHDSCSEAFLNEVRLRVKWPPLRRIDIGEDVIRALSERAAALTDHDCDAVREKAIGIVAGFASRGLLPAIRLALHHGSPETRRAAIRAVAELEDEASIKALTDAVRDSHAAVRKDAADALGRLCVTDAEPLLTTLLADPDGEVRLAAINALGELGTETACEALRAQLRSGDRPAMQAAAHALSPERMPRKTLPTEQRRMEKRGTAACNPFTSCSLDTAVRFALPPEGTLHHRELTDRLAAVCSDYSATRRYLVSEGILAREANAYTMLPYGQLVWRVERFILDRFLLRRPSVAGRTP